MNWFTSLTAGLAYFILGGLWFSPFLFGKIWDRAIGFERPARWKPAPIYYVGPLAGCLVAAAATNILVNFVNPTSLQGAVLLGVVIGIGFGATISGVNSISPTSPAPGTFTAVTGGYHFVGLLICALISYAWK